MPRIIVLDKIADEGLALLKNTPGIEYEVQTGWKTRPVEELRDALKNFDGAIVRSGATIKGPALEGNTRLKVIVRAGVGTDNIDDKLAKRLGIVVMNTPAGNTISTAEHADRADDGAVPQRRTRVPEFDRRKVGSEKYMGTQLAGKTLGIVGLGTYRPDGRLALPGPWKCASSVTIRS
ncbi:MAG: hypothetical protein QM775_12855 [Pirellulales bacterium]